MRQLVENKVITLDFVMSNKSSGSFNKKTRKKIGSKYIVSELD